MLLSSIDASVSPLRLQIQYGHPDSHSYTMPRYPPLTPSMSCIMNDLARAGVIRLAASGVSSSPLRSWSRYSNTKATVGRRPLVGLPSTITSMRSTMFCSIAHGQM